MMSLRNVAKFAQQCGYRPSRSLLGSSQGAAELCGVRPASTDAGPAKASGGAKPNAIQKPVKRVVFISQSTDVYANLAFEDWLYRNWTFDRRQILFLWRNSPCVVIGRHQNPYVEANLPYLESARVPVVRRNSGGGTVYHDEGNLNMTFFTERNRYNRKENLEVICRALQEDFGIDAQANERDDVIVNDMYKVSGSAAKLGRTAAYHHCTLLVGSDKTQLKLALQGDKSIASKATASVPAPIMNLKEVTSEITVEELIKSIGQKYLETTGKDQLMAKQNFQRSNGYTLVNPTDDWFPGLAKLKEELASEEWLYNKTPRFTITRPVTLPECIAHNTTVSVTVQAYHGIIEDMKVSSSGLCPEVVELIKDIGTAIKGTPFNNDVFHNLVNRMRLPPPLRTHRSVV
ncbi:lipoyl amidotransferase LIPT1, mitochondrial-like [Penaeus indicus]|uniref:lipoyl amidotransferase LIPT1, mitochondrial-like n=1 Tax=Penaeus indicus TaxID=29960 RepID=UPI00300CB4EA